MHHVYIFVDLKYMWNTIFCSFLTARENCELDIQLFREVFEHIARCDRVLTQPGGSLLLAGRSGVGRRTAVTLAAHTHRIDVVSPKLSKNYSVKQFKIDLKTVSDIKIWTIYIHA